MQVTRLSVPADFLAAPLFSQAGFRAWSFGDLAITVVIAVAVIALVYIALRQFGIAVPAWFVNVLCVVIVAVVIIVAIRFLMTL